MALERDLGRGLLEEFPLEAAAIIDQLSDAEAAAILGEAAPGRAATVLGHLAPQRARAVLSALQPDARRDVLDRMVSNLAATILRAASEADRDRLLRDLAPARRRSLERLLGHAPDSVGALLDPQVPALPQDWTANAALDALRHGDDSGGERMYVIDREGRFVGTVCLRELLVADGERPLSSLVSTDLPTLRGESSAAAAARHHGWARADALPVVDAGGLFTGALSLRTLYQRLAGPSSPLGAAASGQETVGALSELLTLAWGGVLETVVRNQDQGGSRG